MSYATPRELALLGQAIDAEQQRIDDYSQEATAEIAARLGRLYMDYGQFVDPSVLGSIGMFGDPSIDMAAVGALAVLEQARVGAPDSMAPGERPDNGGNDSWLRSGIGWVSDGIGTVASAGLGLVGNVVERTNIDDVLKAGSRNLITAALAPYEMVVTGLSPQNSSGLPGVSISPGMIESTTFGQALNQQITEGRVDMGSGFFPAGTVAQRQAEAARKYRGTVTSPWGEQAWTFGRGIASAFGLSNDEVAWQMVSGIGDLAAGVVLDPVNWIPPGTVAKTLGAGRAVSVNAVRAGDGLIATSRSLLAKADDAMRAGDSVAAMMYRSQADDLVRQATRMSGVEKAASKADEAWRDVVDSRLGLIPTGTTHRQAVVSQNTLRWFYSTDARKLFEDWIPGKTWVDIWRRSNGKIDVRTAMQLADARDVPGRVGILANAIQHGSVGYLPTAGPIRGRSVSGVSRVFNHLEEGHRLVNRRVSSTNIFFDPKRLDESAENVYRLLAKFKITKDERVRAMDPLIRALALPGDDPERTGAIFRAIGNDGGIEDIFAARLVDKGVNDDVARAVTRYTGSADRGVIWGADQSGRQTPLGFITRDETGQEVFGPVFTIDGINEGVQLIDPTDLDQIGEELSAWRRVMGATGLAVNDPTIAGKTTSRAMRRIPVDLIRAYQERVWKRVAIMRAAFIARVVPEEVARMMMGGSFDHPAHAILAVIGSRYATDIYGKKITAKALMERMGKDPTGAYADMIDALGRSSMARSRLDIMDYGTKAFRSGHSSLADYRVKPDLWKRGLREQYLRMSNDVPARVLAAGGPQDAIARGIIGDFTVQTDSGPRLWSSLSDAEKAQRGGSRGVVEWLMSPEEGSWYRRKYEAMMRAYNPNADFDDPAIVQAWVDQMGNQIFDWTGGRGDLTDVIADRGFRFDVDGNTVEVPLDYRFGDDEAIDAILEAKGVNGTKGGYLLNLDLNRWLEDGTALPEMVPYIVPKTAPRRIDGRVARIGQAWDEIGTKFFTGVYGKTSDLVARSPEMRAAYWRRVTELAPSMQPDEAAKMLKAAEKAKLDRGVLAELRRAVKGAVVGGATRDDVHRVAGAFAADDVKKLFYDASNARNWTLAVGIAMPFANAWAEVLGTWMRLLRQDPLIWYQGSRVYSALRNGSLSGDENAKGFVWNDPQTGEDIFTYPLSGAATKLFLSYPTEVSAAGGGVVGGVVGGATMGGLRGGLVGAGIGAAAGALAGSMLGETAPVAGELTGSVKSLSIGASFMPGLGPVASIGMSELLPDVPEFDVVRDMLLPYGAPESVQSTLVPPWLDKMAALYSPWADGSRVFANEYATAIGVLAASDGYGESFEEKERLHEDARNTARAMTVLRGIGNFVGPASPMSEYVTPTGGQIAEEARRGTSTDEWSATRLLNEEYGMDIDASNVLMSEMVTVHAKLKQKDYRTADEQFIRLFGTRPYYAMTSKSLTLNGGLNVTSKFGQWERDNEGFVDTYEDVSGYFGPHDDGDLDFDTYRRQIERGARRPKTVDEYSRSAQVVLGRFMVDQFREQLPARESDWTEEHRAALRGARRLIAELLPGYDPTGAGAEASATRDRRIRELIDAADDDRMGGNDVAAAVKEYERFRRIASLYAVQQGYAPEGWKRNQSMAHVRDFLRVIGERLVERYPDFVRAWEELFVREMDDDDREVIVNG